MPFLPPVSCGAILFMTGNITKRPAMHWWISRIGYSYRLYDIVRVDHFRGFEAYFSIPYGDETAVNR